MSGTSVDGLRRDLDAGIDPLEALAAFRAAQDAFHAAFVARDPVSCRRGCSACCAQMVFDVTPVEIEDLGRHLRTTGRDAEALERLAGRRAAFDRTRVDLPRRPGESHDDWTERVGLKFWGLGLDCAFLDAQGACSVFEHRPQSCRRFYVHGPAQLCTPADAGDPTRRSRMVEPGGEGEVDALLALASDRVGFDPEDDRLDHALLRWLENRSRS